MSHSGNHVSGTAGADTLSSLTGAATQEISGLGGSDTLVIRRPDPTRDQEIAADGGADYDVLRILEATHITGMSVSGAGGTISVSNPDQNPQTIVYTGIEKIVISGIVSAPGGIVTGASDDEITVTGASVPVAVSSGGGDDVVRSAVGVTVHGGEGADTIVGSSETDVLNGGPGDDNIAGNGGNDTLNGGTGLDVAAGGIGNDTYYVDDGRDRVVEAPDEGIDRVWSTVSYTLPDNVETLVLTGTGAIDGTGNALNNVISGNAAANVLSGGDGSDALSGGAGADRMIGGRGDDTYTVDTADDVVVELGGGGGFDTIQSSVTLTLAANVERLILIGGAAINGTGNELSNVIVGNDAANVLTGGGGHDVLDGRGGADTMIGGTGNDIYYVDDLGDTLTEGAAAGIDSVHSSVSHTLGANFENLQLTGSADIEGAGNALSNSIAGNAGANLLDGGAGNDLLYGGLGNDTYIVDHHADRAKELSAAGGTDHVLSSVSFILEPHVEHLTLTGTGNIFGIGNASDNVIIGNSGNNTLAGGGGADELRGGAGNDIYTVSDDQDLVVELPGGGTDAAQSSISYVLPDHVEYLQLVGSAAINGTGNALDNQISGNGASNVLDGGAGIDAMFGGAGNDVYIVDNAADRAIELNAQGGVDEVRSSVTFRLGAHLENLTLTGTANADAFGNELGNTLTGNSGANLIDGKAGSDVLAGLDGADTFAFTTALAGNADRIVDFAPGVDRILLGGGVGEPFAALATGALAAGAFAIGAAASGADDRIVYNSQTGALLYDADGAGGAAGVQFALLAPGLALSAADFIVSGLPNRAPGISSPTSASVAENSPASTVVYRAVASDPDGDTFTFRLTGADAARLSIDATGAVRLLAPADYETRTSYSFTVEAYDSSGAAGSRPVTLTITDVADTNRAPVISSGATASVAENSPASTIVYRAVASDPDGDALGFRLSGADAARLSIDSTGAVRLLAPADYETKTSYSFTVEAYDPSGATGSRPVTLTITDVADTNRAPVISSGPTGSVAENSPASTIVYQAVASDPDGDPISWELTGTDAASFTIDAGGAVRLLAPADYETKASYTFAVHANDPGGLGASRLVILNVTDVVENLPPYNLVEQEPNGSAGTALALDRSRMAVTDNANLPEPTLPSATIQGHVAAGGDRDFFSISLEQGELLLLDVDGTNALDAFLRVYGPDGREIAFNDDAIAFDQGSSAHSGASHNMDSIVRVRAPASGTYTFSIASFVNDAGSPTSSGTYTLNVSVGPPADSAEIHEENVEALLSGSRWSSLSLTYGFTTSASDYGFNEGRDEIEAGMAPLNSAQRSSVMTILGQISSLTDLSFTLLSANPGAAQMRYALSSDPDTAHAYYPGAGNGGDSWYNTTGYTSPAIGNYQWFTFIHETGHALGLKHGHEAPPLSPDRDSLEYSVMTYRGYIGAPTDEENGGYRNETWGYPQTLMMYDIAALQRMYGADFSLNGGDTVYGWNAVTGGFLINGVTQWTPGSGLISANRVFMTVWDGGGTDTYDLSNYSNGVTIDLRPGEWTITSQVQLANLGGGNYARGNVANALLYNDDPRSLIENAVGGSGNDVLIANQAVNRLTGGAGGDSFRLMAAADSRPGAADTITDFVRGADRIDLSFFDADSNAEGHQSFEFVGTGAFTAAGQVRYEATAGGVNVFGDVNGDAIPDFQLILPGVTALGGTDFAFGA